MRGYGFAMSLALAVFALSAGRGIAGEQVPFKGRLAGITTITPLEPPLSLVLVQAKGNATQLGGFTLIVPHVVNFATATGTGVYKFRAANGDMLLASFNGKAVLTSNPAIFAIEETASVTGGTGRFAGATGNFICQRLFNTITGETIGSFSGSISKGGR